MSPSVGITTLATDRTLSPAAIAQTVEQHGFECLLLGEHTHHPLDANERYPGGGALPEGHDRMLDPLIACMAAAAATTDLLVGTAVCLVTQRDPILLAKEVATLDLLSGGRTLLGIGAGWHLREMRNHSTDPATRFALMKERAEALRRIWTQEEAAYDGEHVRFGPIASWPKPIQRPHPPLLIGGMGDRVLDRVLAYGDGWIPNATGSDDDALLTRVAALKRRGTAAGRTIPVTINFAPAGIERLARYEGLVDRCVFFADSRAEDGLAARLDQVITLTERLGWR